MAACTLFGTSASAQSAKDIRGPSPLVAIENEATAKLIKARHDNNTGRLAAMSSATATLVSAVLYTCTNV